MGPPRMNNAGQLQPVHAPRHIDVREQRPHVTALFEEPQGRRRSDRLNHLKASLLQDISREHPDERLILDEEHNGSVRIAYSIQEGSPGTMALKIPSAPLNTG